MKETESGGNGGAGRIGISEGVVNSLCRAEDGYGEWPNELDKVEKIVRCVE